MSFAVVLLPYGFLLEDNQKGRLFIYDLVLLPYGFLLEDNLKNLSKISLACFATIWIFARR